MATPVKTTSPTKIQMSLGLWNMGDKASSVKGKSAIQKTLESIQEPGNAEIMLVQEVKSENVYNAVVNNRGTHENSSYKGFLDSHQNVGPSKAKSIAIIYDHDIFEDAERLSVNALRYRDEIHRLDVFVVNIVGIKCLLASWHGRTRLTDTGKQEKLKNTLKYLKNEHKENKCDVCIIGGDFNLDIKKVEDAVPDFDVHTYPTPELRSSKKKGIIDFLISWPKGRVRMQESPKAVDVVPQERKDVFDHQLIWHKLEIDVTPTCTTTSNTPGSNSLWITPRPPSAQSGSIYSPTSSYSPFCPKCDELESRVNDLERKFRMEIDELKKKLHLMATPFQQLTDIAK